MPDKTDLHPFPDFRNEFLGLGSFNVTKHHDLCARDLAMLLKMFANHVTMRLMKSRDLAVIFDAFQQHAAIRVRKCGESLDKRRIGKAVSVALELDGQRLAARDQTPQVFFRHPITSPSFAS